MSLYKYHRQRGKNFTKAEEQLLLELVNLYKHIINKSRAIPWEYKCKAWEELSQKFSLQTGVQRSWKALRYKYNSIKSKLHSNKSTNGDELRAMPVKSETFEILEFEESCVEINEVCPSTLSIVETVESISSSHSASNCSSDYLQQQEQTKFALQRANERTLREEKEALMVLQKEYYQNEMSRRAERFNLRLKSLKLKRQLLLIKLEARQLNFDKGQTLIKLENGCNYP